MEAEERLQAARVARRDGSTSEATDAASYERVPEQPPSWTTGIELDLIELVMAIEEELGIAIADEELDVTAATGRRPATIPLASKYMRFDLPQQYLSTDNTVAELIELVRRIQRQSTER